MLLFISERYTFIIKIIVISIHLMLLFIDICPSVQLTEVLISIHLMLLFIYTNSGISDMQSVISIHLMLLFIAFAIFSFMHLANFNTSHVTVYPTGALAFSSFSVFQYISCYCLSSCACNAPAAIA